MRPANIFTLALVLTAPTALLAETTLQSDNAMEEVVVVASKIPRPLSRVASQVTSFHRDDLDRLQIQSLSDIARYQPALEAEYDGNRFGSTGIAIRGIGGNRVAMELDGVPLPKQFSIGEFAASSRTTTDPAVIERIEVLRGPASSLYGSDAIGGVVIVETQTPAALISAGNTAYFGGGGGWFGADSSRLAYGTAAFKSQNNEWLFSLDHREGNELANQSDDVADDRSDQSAYHGLAKWVHHLGDDSHLEAILDVHEREVQSDIRSVLGFGRQYASTVSLTGDDRQNRKRASISYKHTGIEYLNLLEMQVYYQNNDTTQITRDLRASAGAAVSEQLDRAFNFEARSHGVEVKFRKDYDFEHSSHVWVAGLEWDHETLKESRDGLLTDFTTGTTSKVLPPGELFPTRDLPKTEADQFGAYIQNEIALGSVTLIPALRWDRYVLDASTDVLVQNAARLTDLDENNLSAKLGATWRVSDDVTVYGHFAEGFRSPPAEDVNLVLDYSGRVRVRALPNPDLESETSDNLEVGIRYHGNALRLDWAIYESHFDNFIESRVPIGVDPNDGALLFQSRNINESKIYGSEINASIELDNWRGAIGYHWSRGKNEQTGEPINSISPAKTVFSLAWQPNATFDADITISHLSEQRDVDFSGGAFYVPEAATVIDLSLRYAPVHWAEIYFGLNNLSDRKYERYNDVRGLSPNDPRVEQLSRPGRNLAVTVHIRPS